MEKKIDEILLKLDKLDVIQADVKDLKEVSNNNSEKISDLTRKNESLDARINILEKQLKKRNLIFNGLPDNISYNLALEKNISSIVGEQLNIQLVESEIEECFRLGKISGNQNNPTYCRPVLVAFRSVHTRNHILKNRTKFKGTKIFINEDLSTQERQDHKEMVKLMKKHRQDGYEVKIIRNKLHIINQQTEKDNNENKRGRDRVSSEDTPTKPTQLRKQIKPNIPNSTKTRDKGTLDSFLVAP